VISSKSATQDAYCITNANRPLLCVGAKGNKGGRKTYLYVEAICKFTDEVREMNLEDAYKLAKNAFTGRMEHTFIVLKEEESRPAVTGANMMPVGSKRPAADDDELQVLSPKRMA